MKKFLCTISTVFLSCLTSSASAMGMLLPSPHIEVGGLDKVKFYLQSTFVIEIVKIILLILLLVFVIRISITLRKMLNKQ